MSQDARRVHPSVVAGTKPAPPPGFIESVQTFYPQASIDRA
jgi:hypothetical protein